MNCARFCTALPLRPLYLHKLRLAPFIKHRVLHCAASKTTLFLWTLSRSACVLQELGWKYTQTISNFVRIFLLNPNFLLAHRSRYSEVMDDGQMTPRGYPNFNSYLKNLGVLVFWTDKRTNRHKEIHLLRVGWRNLFFQLCCCVSFLFWWEIGFGFTYSLCT